MGERQKELERVISAGSQKLPLYRLSANADPKDADFKNEVDEIKKGARHDVFLALAPLFAVRGLDPGKALDVVENTIDWADLEARTAALAAKGWRSIRN